MSAWRIITKNLYAAGGGPVHANAFDMPDLSRETFWGGIYRAKELGMIENTVSSWGNAARGRWSLTQKGRDWCDGRLGDEYRHRKLCIVATWLKALPRAGEIQLQGKQC